MLRLEPAVVRIHRKIRVAILDDHQGIVDGYLFRLGGHPRIDIVDSLRYGEQLGSLMERKDKPDVLLLDIGVPTSAENPNPFPVLHAIAALLEEHPELHILIISMFADPGLIRAAMAAGASGYVLKEDYTIVRDLASTVMSVADGGICISPKALQALLGRDGGPARERLTARQLEALSLCAAYPDQTTGDFARMMAVSHSTVRNLLSGAYLRLDVRTRAAAVEKARQIGLITPRLPTPSA